jgi:hypothetical protein
MKKTDLSDAMSAFDLAAIERLQPNFAASEKALKGDIMVRLPRSVRQKLKQLALARDTTVQRLMEEAIDLILIEHGLGPAFSDRYAASRAE